MAQCDDLKTECEDQIFMVYNIENLGIYEWIAQNKQYVDLSESENKLIYDDENNGLIKRSHFMYPNEARLRNMTYGTTIHYDIEVDFIMRDSDNNVRVETVVLEKIFLGRFPIMLQSELCILNGLNPSVRFNMGECRND